MYVIEAKGYENDTRFLCGYGNSLSFAWAAVG